VTPTHKYNSHALGVTYTVTKSRPVTCAHFPPPPSRLRLRLPLPRSTRVVRRASAPPTSGMLTAAAQPAAALAVAVLCLALMSASPCAADTRPAPAMSRRLLRTRHASPRLSELSACGDPPCGSTRRSSPTVPQQAQAQGSTTRASTTSTTTDFPLERRDRGLLAAAGARRPARRLLQDAPPAATTSTPDFTTATDYSLKRRARRLLQDRPRASVVSAPTDTNLSLISPSPPRRLLASSPPRRLLVEARRAQRVDAAAGTPDPVVGRD